MQRARWRFGGIVTIRGQYVEGEPKTHAGTRVVQLPTFAIDVLKTWRTVQLERG